MCSTFSVSIISVWIFAPVSLFLPFFQLWGHFLLSAARSAICNLRGRFLFTVYAAVITVPPGNWLALPCF